MKGNNTQAPVASLTGRIQSTIDKREGTASPLPPMNGAILNMCHGMRDQNSPPDEFDIFVASVEEKLIALRKEIFGNKQSQEDLPKSEQPQEWIAEPELQEGEIEALKIAVPPGNYILDINGKPTIFMVRISRRGNQYIKDIAGYPLTMLRLLSKSDLRQAGRTYGIKTGKCCVCNRILTDPISITLGIGPECGALERAEYLANQNL